MGLLVGLSTTQYAAYINIYMLVLTWWREQEIRVRTQQHQSCVELQQIVWPLPPAAVAAVLLLVGIVLLMLRLCLCWYGKVLILMLCSVRCV